MLILVSCSEDEDIAQFEILTFEPQSVLEGERIKLIVSNLPHDKKNLILEVNSLEYPIESIFNDTLYAYVPIGANTGQLRLIYKDKDAISNNQLVINKFEILDFIPNVGFIDEVISISGNGFTTEKEQIIVEFNGVNAEVVQANENTILAKVPDGATTGRISITLNGSTVISTYDFKVAENPNGGGGGNGSGSASSYLPKSTNTYLFENWDFDEEDNRAGTPYEDSTYINDNVFYKSYQSKEYNILPKTNLPSSKKFYRAENNVLYADGESESQLPPFIAEEIGNDIEWVPILDLQNLSWLVYEFEDVEFTFPFNGQDLDITVSSIGTAKRNPNTRMESIAGTTMEIIEVEYTFNTSLTISFGPFPITQEIEAKSIYWFSKEHGIVREISFNSETSGGGGFPIGGDISSAGERILKRIYQK